MKPSSAISNTRDGKTADSQIPRCGVAEQEGFNPNENLAAKTLLNMPSKLVADGNDRLFIVDRGNKRICMVQLNEEPMTSRTFGSEVSPLGEERASRMFVDPFDIALDKRGNLYCTDPGSAQIYEFNTDGQSIALPSEIYSP